MAAAVAVAALGKRPLLGNTCLLAQPRQRIELAEDGNDRSALARLAHDRRRHAGNATRHAEALSLQKTRMLGRRAKLLVVGFGRIPDPIAEHEKPLALGFEEIPDGIGIFHRLLTSATIVTRIGTNL
ncbi:hypothetical protein D9M72_617100 [compost metagenome]